MTDITYHIDLKKTLEVALLGTRRASAFMGLGVNAALDMEFTKYQLTQITKIQLLPDNIPPEVLNHIKEEFKVWVEGNGFRELVETFSVFLDNIYQVCAAVEASGKRIEIYDFQKKMKKYGREGFPNKLNILSSNFNVKPQHADYIKSLNKARNCLTHRRGIVGAEDTDGQYLCVRWLGMNIFIQTPSGEKHPLENIPDGGLYLPDGGNVMLQFDERERQFPLGELLKLSTKDLAEICWFFQQQAISTISSTTDYLKSAGVKILDDPIEPSEGLAEVETA